MSNFDLAKAMWLRKARRQRQIRTISGAPPLTFKANGAALKDYRIYGNDGGVGDLATDTADEHYGKYKISVTCGGATTKIYLDEPLRMVGDEADYVDFGGQTWHRVRKNLLQNTATSQTINGVTFTVNNDGSVTCNGAAKGNANFFIASNMEFLYGQELILSGCLGGTDSTYRIVGYRLHNDTAQGTVYVTDIEERFIFENTHGNAGVRIQILSGYTCDNLTFYPMIRKADIEDDTYELYIKNTELDVTLPALPTLSGTNTLSVGTEVQPSSVTVKSKIKKLEGGG